jgi:hypothetical protein
MVASLDKPNVRQAANYIHKHATNKHAVALLPAPWYHPILERYLLGICPDLVHARSFDGWWQYGDCRLEEFPMEESVFGFPGTPDRMYNAVQRPNIDYLWVVDIRDHRFGLPVPPTEPQERFLCWEQLNTALMDTRKFGKWVTVALYDAKKMRLLKRPPPPLEAFDHARVVTSAQSWELHCKSFKP